MPSRINNLRRPLRNGKSRPSRTWCPGRLVTRNSTHGIMVEKTVDRDTPLTHSSNPSMIMTVETSTDLSGLTIKCSALSEGDPHTTPGSDRRRESMTDRSCASWIVMVGKGKSWRRGWHPANKRKMVPADRGRHTIPRPQAPLPWRARPARSRGVGILDLQLNRFQDAPLHSLNLQIVRLQ